MGLLSSLPVVVPRILWSINDVYPHEVMKGSRIDEFNFSLGIPVPLCLSPLEGGEVPQEPELDATIATLAVL